MQFTVGELIILGIVAIVLFVYRQLDRNNRSLEKVKKYADKLKEDIDAFVGVRAQDMRDFAIELDVHQKSAKELLSRLQNVETQLNSRADSIALIEKRIVSYDKTLDELLGMTERADENLKRLRDETEFAEQVAKKVLDARSKVDELERELPAIRAKFDDDNRAALEQFCDTITLGVTKRAEDAEQRAANSARLAGEHEAKAEATLSSLERAVEESFERARKEAEKLESIAFAKLKESINGRATKLQDALEEKYVQLQQAAKEKIQDTQGMIKSFKSEWQKDTDAALESNRALMATIETKLEETERGIDEHFENFAEKAQGIERLYAERLEKVEKKGSEVAETITAKLKDTVQKHKDDATAKIADLKTAMQSFTQESRGLLAEREKELVEAVDRRLADYRADTGFKFARLEEVNADIGKMEEALRASMNSVETKVERDFSAFGETMNAKQKENEARLEREMSDVHAAMDKLESGLAELKGKAYANVSEKLQMFEDDFFADIKKRSITIDERLDQWKTDLDATLAGLTGSLRDEREAAERSMAEDLKGKLSETESKLTLQLERLEEETLHFQSSIRELQSMGEEQLKAFKESVKQDLEDARKSGVAALHAEFQRMQISQGETLKKNERETELRLKNLQDEIDAAKSLTDSSFEAIRSDVTVFEEQSKIRIREADQDAKEKMTTLSQQVEGTSRDIAKLRQELSQKTTQALDSFARTYENLVQDVQKKSSEIQSEADVKTREIRAVALDLKDKVESVQGKLFARIEDQVRVLGVQTEEVDKRIKAFSQQTKVFERADELKVKLDRDLDDLKADLAKVESRRAELVEIETQIGKIKRIEDEVNQKMTRFLGEKRKIESMEEDFKKLLAMSQSVESKLDSVTQNDDALSDMQARLRKLFDASNEAETKYERMEKKGQVIEATNEAVERNFKTIQSMEQTVRSVEAELKSMPDRVIDLKRSVETVTESKAKIDVAVKKLNDLDAIMETVEERTAEVAKAREWIARTETRLEEIYRQAQEQVKILGDIMKTETKSGTREKGAPPVSVRETVSKLARQGWSVEEIARAVKVSRGEVELILELNPKN